jgi:UDP-2,4-diacetamido-2,4,6-trideoxy-beta-L-altropyranose hydrolase
VHIVFRADASLQIGIGHVMRCLALADGLRTHGQQVSFICRTHAGNLIQTIEQQGFVVFAINNMAQETIDKGDELAHANWLGAAQHADAEACREYLESIKPDWLIVDHYALDYRWQGRLQAYYKKLMVIDDLADRKHICQLLLDQTYARQLSDYQALIPRKCQLLLGPEYALLRPEFADWREMSQRRRYAAQLKTMLITLGGVDKDNVTGQVLSALNACVLPADLTIIVVLGATAPHLSAVQKIAASMQNTTEVKVNVDNMAELMANSDIAIGAAGATTWERCCLGLPTIALVLAKNQLILAQHLAAAKVIWLMQQANLPTELNMFFADLSLADMVKRSRKSMQLVDGLGVNKVVQALMHDNETSADFG